MARISFKGKAEKVYHADDTAAYECVRIPTLTRKHCDMHAFRQHSKYGSYANSDLFPGILKRIRSATFGASDVVRLDRIPEGVNVDASGFLVVVTIDV